MDEKFTFFHSGPFSQWHPSQFVDEDSIEYSCAEQYMMYKKAVLFGDSTSAKKILKTRNPREQKCLGRKIKGFKESTWKKHREEIVFRGNLLKFGQNPTLQKRLLETTGTTLVEASPADQIWGIGLREGDQRTLCRKTWRGLNLLGEILVKVRCALQNAVEEEPENNK